MRARKALQYAGSIDEYTKIMLDGNNGGYANDWLLGDRKTGEIAQLELGLKAYKLWRTKDGVLAGSNWARDPKVLKMDAPEFDPGNKESSPNARRGAMGGIAERKQRKDRCRACRKNAGATTRIRLRKKRMRRTHALRTRRWIAARSERVGLATLTIRAGRCKERPRMQR